MRRQEFSARTKVEAFAAAMGRCQSCGVKLTPATGTEYDHSTACALGGDNSITNIVVLCRNCHGTKTSRDDMPRIAKAKRNERSRAGIRKPRTMTRWRKMSGQPVFATRER